MPGGRCHLRGIKYLKQHQCFKKNHYSLPFKTFFYCTGTYSPEQCPPPCFFETLLAQKVGIISLTDLAPIDLNALWAWHLNFFDVHQPLLEPILRALWLITNCDDLPADDVHLRLLLSHMTDPQSASHCKQTGKRSWVMSWIKYGHDHIWSVMFSMILGQFVYKQKPAGSVI